MKTVVLALFTVTAGVLVFTRTQNAPPADLRDAVASDGAAAQLFKSGSSDRDLPIPSPEPALSETNPKVDKPQVSLPRGQVLALLSLAEYVQYRTSALKLVKNNWNGREYYFTPLGDRQRDDSFDLKGFELEYLQSTDDMGGCYGYTFHVSPEGAVTAGPAQVDGNPNSGPANLANPEVRKFFDKMLRHWLKDAAELPLSNGNTHFLPPDALRIPEGQVGALRSLAKHMREKTSEPRLVKKNWMGGKYYYFTPDPKGFELEYRESTDDMGGGYGYTFRISPEGVVTADPMRVNGNPGGRPANLSELKVRKIFDDMLQQWVKEALKL